MRLIETIPDERHVVANDRVGEINRKFGTHAFAILCSERKRISGESCWSWSMIDPVSLNARHGIGLEEKPSMTSLNAVGLFRVGIDYIIMVFFPQTVVMPALCVGMINTGLPSNLDP